MLPTRASKVCKKKNNKEIKLASMTNFGILHKDALGSRACCPLSIVDAGVEGLCENVNCLAI